MSKKNKEKKKKSFARRFFKTVTILGVTAVAGYVLYQRSQPQEDPWAEAYWENVKA